jgi:hypothetical protein
MNCGTLRHLTYSLAVCTVLALAGVFFVEDDYALKYSFTVSLIPVSVILTAVIFALRSSQLSMEHPKETITVAVKNAQDTMQLLELTASGRHMDPLVGTNKFSLHSKFMLFYGLTACSALLLILPAGVPYLLGEEVSEFSALLTTILSFALFAGFSAEYYTCCKAKYWAAKTIIVNAKIVRYPWISYLELEP